MPAPERLMDGMAAVLLGAFNPAIFQPAWFASQELITPTEAEEAEIAVIHAEIVRFSLDWMNLQVTHDQFMASTPQASHFGRLRDLVTNTFKILRHTPTRMCGLNRDSMMRFSDESQWNGLGWTLVPQENWGSLVRPGMQQLTVQGMRPDDHTGYVRVALEPILDGSLRLAIRVNDHFEFSQSGSPEATAKITDLIATEWEPSLKRSEEIIASVIELAASSR